MTFSAWYLHRVQHTHLGPIQARTMLPAREMVECQPADGQTQRPPAAAAESALELAAAAGC